ncbi:GNAT family N-acetyltransferase [Paenibacillus aestuarii]|uniref:GNAT family N-acetyltransferase n=1 Tax=Paenibacillus aestuarii TaxID=516965 RepID=A0ABW0KHB3_9BACL|nr:GNAT family N-acetyltransferase [Paenibacillus aestuarii]
MEIRNIEKELAWQLRHEVMWPEKDADYVKLPDDDKGRHYGLFAENQLISVVSLFIDGSDGQFRKFATRVSEQNKGYGSILLNHLLVEAQQAGIKRIFCNARREKSRFYEKFGLAATEEMFTKDGKEYIIMERVFA